MHPPASATASVSLQKLIRLLARSLSFLFLALAGSHAFGIDQYYGGQDHFFSTDPTDTQIPDWQQGWGAAGLDGWDYVGKMGIGSAVYLGNGWAMTCAHVPVQTLSLDGTDYTPVAGSTRSISNGLGTADISLFQIIAPPSLPSLSIATAAPRPVTDDVAMVGFGGGGESWGYNSVSQDNVHVQVNSDVTNDFETLYGAPMASGSTNDAYVYSGDSGGGDFIYNTSSSQWQLAGLNEANDSSDDSYLVQLNTYAAQINAITAVPEPGSYALSGASIAMLLAAGGMSRRRRIARR